MSDNADEYAYVPVEESAPRQSANAAVPASRGRRFAAYFVDSILFAVSMGIVSLCAMDGISNKPDLLIFLSLCGLIFFLALVVVQFVFLVRSRQTIGKRFFGMCLVNAETQGIPSLARVVFLRYGLFWLLMCIPMIGSLIALADAVAIFGIEQRCLHDRTGKTIVVMKPSA